MYDGLLPPADRLNKCINDAFSHDYSVVDCFLGKQMKQSQCMIITFFNGVRLTCAEAMAAAARSEIAVWPSGSSADELQIWAKAWGFLLSPHCLLGLPLLSRSCHCAFFCKGSQVPCFDHRLKFQSSHPGGPES